MSDTYTCAACQETFDKAWTDEEAAAEYAEKFTSYSGATATVCDDCWKKMTAHESHDSVSSPGKP